MMREDLYKIQYFDEEVVKHGAGEAEVFLDCGSFDGYTVNNFVDWCGGEYDEIISFEPDEKLYSKCVENIEKKYKNATVKNVAIGREHGELRFKNDNLSVANSMIDPNGNQVVQVVSIDEIMNGKRATFIKMDIEGFELEALRGGQKTISMYKPKLAICVYHKPEDVFEIPKYILSLRDDYKIYFRHYSLSEIETILYAI